MVDLHRNNHEKYSEKFTKDSAVLKLDHVLNQIAECRDFALIPLETKKEMVEYASQMPYQENGKSEQSSSSSDEEPEEFSTSKCVSVNRETFFGRRHDDAKAESQRHVQKAENATTPPPLHPVTLSN